MVTSVHVMFYVLRHVLLTAFSLSPLNKNLFIEDGEGVGEGEGNQVWKGIRRMTELGKCYSWT